MRYARPRKRCVATIADAIECADWPFGLMPCGIAKANHRIRPSGLLLHPDTKAGFARHEKPQTLRTVFTVIAVAWYALRATTKAVCCDSVREAREAGVFVSADRPFSCLAQGDNPKEEAKTSPWPGRMPKANGRRRGFKMRSICRLRKLSWSRVAPNEWI